MEPPNTELLPPQPPNITIAEFSQHSINATPLHQPRQKNGTSFIITTDFHDNS